MKVTHIVKAIGFDLGNTLLSYGNTPLSWQSRYKEALNLVANNCGLMINKELLSEGERILTKYNTRLNEREEEVTADRIFGELLGQWGLPKQRYLKCAKETFFEYFQKDSVLYDDVMPIFSRLKNNGVKIGILTDMPYGMDKEFLERDLQPISGYVDSLLTSVEIGLRKPNVQGYLELAGQLGTEPRDMAYVGDEEKDIIGSNNAGMYSIFIDRNDSCAKFGQKRSIKKLTELVDIH